MYRRENLQYCNCYRLPRLNKRCIGHFDVSYEWRTLNTKQHKSYSIVNCVSITCIPYIVRVFDNANAFK